MAPEILRNDPYYSLNVDVWSAGVMLFEMLSGIRPFVSASEPLEISAILHNEPRKLPAEFSEEIQNLITFMLNRNPKERPSIKEVLKRPILRQYVEEFI